MPRPPSIESVSHVALIAKGNAISTQVHVLLPVRILSGCEDSVKGGLCVLPGWQMNVNVNVTSSDVLERALCARLVRVLDGGYEADLVFLCARSVLFRGLASSWHRCALAR